jgi:hypothetical protein
MRRKLAAQLLDFVTTLSLLFILKLCEIPDVLPPDFCETFLRGLNSGVPLTQLKVEYLAIYAKRHQILPQLFEYVTLNQNLTSCVLLSALFTY